MKNSNKGPSKGRKTIKAYFAASSGGDFGDLVLSTVMGWSGEKHRKAWPLQRGVTIASKSTR